MAYRYLSDLPQRAETESFSNSEAGDMARSLYYRLRLVLRYVMIAVIGKVPPLSFVSSLQ